MACLRFVAFIPLAGEVQPSLPSPFLCFRVAEPRLSLMYDFINAGFTYSLDLDGTVVVAAPATKTGTCTTCTFSSSVRWAVSLQLGVSEASGRRVITHYDDYGHRVPCYSPLGNGNLQPLVTPPFPRFPWLLESSTKRV